MKTLKICLVILCLLPVQAVGLPRFSGATFFMKEIIIKSKKYGVHKLLVDDVDYDNVNSKKWHVNKMSHTFYASTEIYKNGIKTQIRVHRFILGNKHKMIDHKDGNGLNNQRNNLRGCTQRQNTYNKKVSPKNSTGFKGVWFSKERLGTKKYHSQIRVNGKTIFIGYFYDAETAAKEYNKVASKLHGEFANLNKI